VKPPIFTAAGSYKEKANAKANDKARAGTLYFQIDFFECSNHAAQECERGFWFYNESEQADRLATNC